MASRAGVFWWTIAHHCVLILATALSLTCTLKNQVLNLEIIVKLRITIAKNYGARSNLVVAIKHFDDIYLTKLNNAVGPKNNRFRPKMRAVNPGIYIMCCYSSSSAFQI
ncbi:hypothetical protein BpHYR1_033641 [Brachionus plicatilis]|uniref:Uncharacterized protein n=1 Tax=Brachionus plicatilis TaxID=10195 RepID=A0A3M7Q570_BRAPC|nr:hypothetical protein BpHYR1_033641 [Brachionus plicatilis]